MSMTLKDLRDWINQLPTEFDNFGLVNGERGMYDEEYSYRLDKPIVTFDLDEGTEEVIFLHQNRDEWKNHMDDMARNSVTSKEAEDELDEIIKLHQHEDANRLAEKWGRVLNGTSDIKDAIILEAQERQPTDEEMKVRYPNEHE